MDMTENIYAGFWRRVAACIIDFVILFFIFEYFRGDLHYFLLNKMPYYSSISPEAFYEKYRYILKILAHDMPSFLENHDQYMSTEYYNWSQNFLLRISVIILLPYFITFYWCYFAGLESSPLRATIGKLAVGLYVTDTHGMRLSFGRATARYFSKIISQITMVGYWLAGWTEKKQALHDMISGCLVMWR